MGVKKYYRLERVEAIQVTKESLKDVEEFLGDALQSVSEKRGVIWFRPSFDSMCFVGVHLGDYIIRRSDGSFTEESQESFEKRFMEATKELCVKDGVK